MSVNCKSPRELRIEELADQVRALSAENERLRDQLERTQGYEASMSKDAKRYRWLSSNRLISTHYIGEPHIPLKYQKLNEAIDEAMKDD